MTNDQAPLAAFVVLFGGLILMLPLQSPLPGFGEDPFTEFFVVLPGLAAGAWAGFSGIVQCRERFTGTAIFSMLAGIFSLGYVITVFTFIRS